MALFFGAFARAETEVLPMAQWCDNQLHFNKSGIKEPERIPENQSEGESHAVQNRSFCFGLSKVSPRFRRHDCLGGAAYLSKTR
ncbi:MAG: hypothetical protein VYA34_08410 [Myxococcota bacterium]|nr:hypothetical protein [Myxococcota bacterium]